MMERPVKIDGTYGNTAVEGQTVPARTRALSSSDEVASQDATQVATSWVGVHAQVVWWGSDSSDRAKRVGVTRPQLN